MSNKLSVISAGMVGGGTGSLISESHRIAMRIDGKYNLVAGAFSRSQDKNTETGIRLGVSADRVYADFKEMAKKEAGREDGIRIVSVVTPNDSHFEICKTFLEAGIHVICDKPLTGDSASSAELKKLADSRNLILALTHNYSGYEMVREAATLVRSGELGEIRIVCAEHATGWASEPLENINHKQASWRTDPKAAGMASVMFDLGTHAHHLLRFVTGLEVTEVAADMWTSVPGRKVYDDARANLKLSNGARGSLWASMTATGNEHGLRIRVYGTKASLEWYHEDPQHLTIRYKNGNCVVKSHGQPANSKQASRHIRIAGGHPEGFLEAFANIYSEFAEDVQKRQAGTKVTKDPLSYPDAEDGVRGVRFVEATLQSHESGGAWVKVPN